MPVSSTRRIISQVILGFGILFTLLALGVFAIPFIAVAAGTYEGGEQAWGALLFYVLLAFPAFILTVVSIFIRGWKEARAGYITLAGLFGIPIFAFLFGLIQAGFDSVRR